MDRALSWIRRLRWALVAAATAGTFALSWWLYHARQAGAASWDVWRHRAGDFWSWTPFIHPPGYGEYLRLVERIAEAQGTTAQDIGLQLAAVFTTLLVPLVAWGASRELGKSAWTVVAATLIAVSPSFLRPFEDYPLAALLVTASVVAMMSYAREGGLLRWCAVPVFVLLAVELHLNAWFLLGPAMAMLLLVSPGRRLGFGMAIAASIGVFLYSTVQPPPGLWEQFDHPHAYFQGERRFGELRWSDPNLEWTNPLLFAPLVLWFVPAVMRRNPRGVALALSIAFYAAVTTGLMATGLAIASHRAESHHYYELIDPALTLCAVWALASAWRAAGSRRRAQKALAVAVAVLLGWQAYSAVDGVGFLQRTAKSPWLWQGYSGILRLDGGRGPMNGWIVVLPESIDAAANLRWVGHVEVVLSPDGPWLDASGSPLPTGNLVDDWWVEERMGDPEVPELVLKIRTAGHVDTWPFFGIAPGKNADEPFSMQILGYDEEEGGEVRLSSDVVRHTPDPDRPGAAVFMRLTRFEPVWDTCGDGEDNDRDGWRDHLDPGCPKTGGREIDGYSEHPCNDGKDNDGDGAIDRKDDDCRDGRDDEQ